MKSLFSSLRRLSLLAVILFAVIPFTGSAQDVYKALPANTFPAGITTFTGIQYVNSQTYKSPMIDAWNYDSIQFPVTFTDSVNISSIKIVRFAYSSATIGDTSSTLGTLVSTNSAGKTTLVTSVDSGFTNKNACGAYLRLVIVFNSSGNPSGGNIGKKFYPYMHGYKKRVIQ